MKINVYKDISKMRLSHWKGFTLRELVLSTLFVVLYFGIITLSVWWFNQLEVGFMIASVTVLPLGFNAFFELYNMRFRSFVMKRIQLSQGKAYYEYQPLEEQRMYELLEKEEKNVRKKQKHKLFVLFKTR